MRAAVRRVAQDYAAQVGGGRRQALHAHVRMFQFHGPPPRGGLHRAGPSSPPLRLLVHLSGGGRLLMSSQFVFYLFKSLFVTLTQRGNALPNAKPRQHLLSLFSITRAVLLHYPPNFLSRLSFFLGSYQFNK